MFTNCQFVKLKCAVDYVSFVAGVVYLITIVVFSLTNVQQLSPFVPATEDYSFITCIVVHVLSYISAGCSLQALRWQFLNLQLTTYCAPFYG